LLGVLTLLASKIGLIPQVNKLKISDLDSSAGNEHFQTVAAKVFYKSGIPQYFLAVKKE
jgi:hypothetical protein